MNQKFHVNFNEYMHDYLKYLMIFFICPVPKKGKENQFAPLRVRGKQINFLVLALNGNNILNEF